MISGIHWVSELIEAAGGIDVFPELATRKNAKDRIVTAEQVIAAEPDIIIGSWCGKKFVPARVAARPGFAQIPAVRTGFLREIKSTIILQPGPAALTDGLDALMAIVQEWVEAKAAGVLEPRPQLEGQCGMKSALDLFAQRPRHCRRTGGARRRRPPAAA